MGGFSIFTIIVLCLGGIFWLRQSRRRAYAVPTSPAGIPQADVVLSTFAHGNSCLAAGNFSEAITAFQHVLTLAPKHPHVAARMAEVERRQHAESAIAAVNTAS